MNEQSNDSNNSAETPKSNFAKSLPRIFIYLAVFCLLVSFIPSFLVSSEPAAYTYVFAYLSPFFVLISFISALANTDNRISIAARLIKIFAYILTIAIFAFVSLGISQILYSHKEQSRSSTCIEHLKDISNALMLYREDYNGRNVGQTINQPAPLATAQNWRSPLADSQPCSNNAPISWIDKIMPFANESKNFQCPSAIVKNNETDKYSYSYNGMINRMMGEKGERPTPSEKFIPPVDDKEVIRVSEVAFVDDLPVTQPNAVVSPYFNGGSNEKEWVYKKEEFITDKAVIRTHSFNSRTTILFYDGHVESISQEYFKDQAIDHGAHLWDDPLLFNKFYNPTIGENMKHLNRELGI